MIRKFTVASCGMAALAASISVPTGAFTLGEEVSNGSGGFGLGFRWPEPRATLSINIPQGAGEPNWNTAMDQAVARWEAATPFQFTVRRQSAGPCVGDDGLSGAGFNATNCEGITLGDEVLAITRRRAFRSPNGFADAIPGVRGEIAALVSADIVFNANKNWGVFSGQLGNTGDDEDFRRVAVHELGHVMGIEHVDETTGPPAIMREGISRTEYPQSDDIKGVLARYGRRPESERNDPPPECEVVMPLSLGASATGTVLGSCTVMDYVGGTSQLPAKRYRLTISTPGPYTITTAANNDYATRIALYTAGGSLIGSSPNALNASLSADLAAGSYDLVINGVSEGVDGTFALAAAAGGGGTSGAVAGLAAIITIVLDD